MSRPKRATGYRLSRSVAAVGVAALALTACGNNDNDTTTVGADASGSATGSVPAGVGEADQQLVIGTLLPQTGSLSYLGPPEFAGVDLAVKEINDAGGVLGKPVKVVHSDSGDTASNIAAASVDRLFSEKADAIVGAASSSVTRSVLDKVTSAGVLMFSPANTSAELTTDEDRELYFRTAPPDKLQGQVLADEILADNNETLGILALQDSYGTGLADRVEEVFEQGGGQVVEKVIYDPKAQTFSGEVGRIKAKNPDAIAVIAFEETARIIPEMVKQGVGPKQKKIYFTDGNLSNSYGDLPAGVLAGVKGTAPGVLATDAFEARLKGVNKDLTDLNYAAESYDATMLIALGALAAKSDSGKAIAGELVKLSKDGENCSTFAACKALIDAGTDVNYEGVSGPVSFDDEGDPTEATIGVYQYGANNKYTHQKGVKVSLE